MRRILLCTILLITSKLFSQQSFPTTFQNGSFESWTNYYYFYNPTNWSTSNNLFVLGDSITVFRTIDSYQGNYAVQARTVPQGTTYIVGNVTSDYVLVTPPNFPKRLSGYYKCNMFGNDSAEIFVEVDQLDGATYRPIGGGNFMARGVVNTYTKFEFPITIYDTYDSVNYIVFDIVIASTAAPLGSGVLKPSGPNSIKVDALAIDYVTGFTNETLAGSGITVMLNQNTVTVNHMKGDNNTIYLYDLNGKIYSSHTTSSEMTTIYYPNLNSGMYLMKVVGSDGQQSNVFKLVF